MKSPLATAFLAIVFGPFGLFCLVWAVKFSVRAEYLSALVAFGFAVFTLGFLAMLAIAATGKVKPRVAREEAAIMVRPDARVDGLLMASTTGAFLAMAIYAVCAPMGMIDIPVPRGDQRYFVIACAAGVLVGLFSLRQILTRRGTSYLLMTACGIETGNTMSSVHRSWDDVADVSDRPQNGQKSSGATYITTTDGRTRVLPFDWYTPGGRALHELVRFYWQHPEHRDELIDGRAVERLDDGIRGAT